MRILYRDSRLLAVTKPSGMAVHRGWARDDETLADIVRDQFVGAPIHAVHRLDRGTSGVVLFALDPEMASSAQLEFESGRVRKRYLALVRGPMNEACVLDHPIAQRDRAGRVDAITEFEPVSHAGRWSLVEARPLTGRQHQIRRHLKHLSHPIVGDVRYGKGDVNRLFRETYGLARMALHAYSLTLQIQGTVALDVTAAVPADLATPLLQLGLISSRTKLSLELNL